MFWVEESLCLGCETHADLPWLEIPWEKDLGETSCSSNSVGHCLFSKGKWLVRGGLPKYLIFIRYLLPVTPFLYYSFFFLNKESDA